MLLPWWCCRLLGYLLDLPHPPSTKANPYRVFELLAPMGMEPNWGRQVVYVHWLVGIFGHEPAKRIWAHMRKQRPLSCSQQHYVTERSGSPV